MNAAIAPILLILLAVLVLFCINLRDAMSFTGKHRTPDLALGSVHHGVRKGNGDDLKLGRCDRLNGSDQIDRNGSRR